MSIRVPTFLSFCVLALLVSGCVIKTKTEYVDEVRMSVRFCDVDMNGLITEAEAEGFWASGMSPAGAAARTQAQPQT